MLKISTPIVSIDWLFQHLEASNLIIIHASLKKVKTNESDAPKFFKNKIINARVLDIKNIFSETSAKFPNTLLSAKKFQDQVQQLGINKNSALVVYDEYGIYSSPRVWWMFKAMGHENIAILDGGLPEWEKVNFPIESKKAYMGIKGNFTAIYNPESMSDYHHVLHAITEERVLILDARSESRFNGMNTEPRKDVRSGHIPNSKNLPYTKLIVDNKIVDKEKIQNIFNEVVSSDSRFIFTCGTGVTACILALGAEIIGLQNKSVYDGSWTEWGSLKELPIEK